MWPHSPFGTRHVALALAFVGLCRTSLAEPSYEERCQQGRKNLLAEEYAKAEDAFSKAVEVDAARSLAYVGQALAFRATKQYDKARKAASKAIIRDPNDVAALVIRGTAYHALKQLDRAKKDFKKAIAHAPKESAAYAGRGRVLLDQKDEKGAMFDFSQALEFDENDQQTYVARAKLYRRQGEFGNARRDLENAIRLRPKSAPYHFLLAQTHFDNHNDDPAIKMASKVIELDENFTAAYVLKGAALYRQKEYGEALPLLKKAKHDAPMDAGAFLWLGKTLLQLGQIDEAKTELLKALDIDDQYVAAHRALADVYEKTDQRDEATAARKRANALESELRKAAALDQVVADDAGPSRIAETEQFDPSIISAESLQSQIPRAEMLTQKVRALAEKRRQQLRASQHELEVCEATAVVPEACKDADEVFRRSVHQFEIGDYEVAGFGFQAAKTRYEAAIDAFEEKAGKDYTVWLNWSQQRAKRLTDSSQLPTLLTTMAIVHSRLGDKQRYAEIMKEIDSQAQVTGVMDPAGSNSLMFQIAEIRERCGDREGAQAAIKQAAIFCDGITVPAGKSIRLARCAGALVRYGARDMWASHMGKAIKIAGQVGREQVGGSRSKSTGQRQVLYVQCVGYAAAGDVKRAYSYAQKLQQLRDSSSGDSLAFAGTAYAWSALAAARADQSRSDIKQLFEISYVASIIRLMAIWEESSESYVRLLLSEADSTLGAAERAWAGVTCCPSPLVRTLAMRPIVRQECERANLSLAREMFAHLPQGVATIRPACYLAEAEVRFGNRSFVSLRHWVDELRTPADRAVAMAGIALGVKAGRSTSSHESGGGNREDETPGLTDRLPASEGIAPGEPGSQRDATTALATSLLQAPDDARVREAFDKSAAAAGAWWLEQAIAHTSGVEDPTARACLWLQIARAQLKSKNIEGYQLSTNKARDCTVAVWNRILERRLPEKPSINGTFYWESHSRRKKTEFTEILAMLRVLMDLEELQHEAGETQEGVETLLLALRCVELMPKNTSFVQEVSPRCPAAWLMRIAGRLARRGRHNLANLMMADGPWFPARSREYLLSWAAAEANDLAMMKKLEGIERKWADRANRASVNTEVARVNAFLAMVAARRGDRDLYRKTAMKVGGYVSQGYRGASRIVFLDLAEAATAAGEPDAALAYVKHADVRGREEDPALLAIAEKMIELGRVSAAKEIVQDIYDEISAIPGWYHVAAAEASAPSASLSTLYVEANKLPEVSLKAAAMAGIATALHGR